MIYSLENNSIVKRVFPFLSWLTFVNQQTLRYDLLAGLTNAVVVLPQAIAFSLIAGLPPVYGLYSAIVIPIVFALFGSSRHIVVGPTTTVSIALFTAVSAYATRMTTDYITIALLLTIMVGIIQFLLGVVRLGRLVNFISKSVITGYTAGAAILIASNQLENVTGLRLTTSGSFIQHWRHMLMNIGDMNVYSFGIGFFTILVALIFLKFWPRLPNLFIAMVLSSLATYLVAEPTWGVPLVGSLPSKLPHFELPRGVSLDLIGKLIPGAFAVAILGLIEVVTISRSIAIKSRQQLVTNQEFIGLGLSNIIGGFFLSYAGSGSFTRSALNYEVGAKTPMSSIFGSIILLGIVLLMTPLAEHLPLPTVGGIILIVAFKLIDFRSIRQISNASKAEITVLVITFLSTLFFDLQFAILVGVFFSLSLYLLRTSAPAVISIAPNPIDTKRKFMNAEVNKLEECPQLIVVRIDGSLFFGAIEHIKNKLNELRDEERSKILVVCSGVNFVDAAGADFLVREAESWRATGGEFYLCSLKRNVREFLNKGYSEQIGYENIFLHKEEAISKLYETLNRKICDDCEVRIFLECNNKESLKSSW